MFDRRTLALSCLTLLVATTGLVATTRTTLLRAEPPRESRPSPQRTAPAEPENKADQSVPRPITDAERIARLDRSLQSDEKRLNELQGSFTEPDHEYADAEAEFGQLDETLVEKKKQLERNKKTGSLENDQQLREELAAIEKKWTLARDRFELAIRERKAVQESIAALEQKLQRDREALEELRGTGLVETPPVTTDAPGSDKQSHDLDSASSSSQSPPSRSSQSVSHSQSTGSARANVLPTAPADAAQHSDISPPEASPEAATQEPAELAAAAAAAQATDAAANEAEHEAQSISQRIEILQKNIALARELVGTAHAQVDNADAALKSLNEELFRKLREGENTDTLNQQIQDATERVREARAESREASASLDDLQSSLATLQSEQLAAADDAQKKRGAAQKAEAVVKVLSNPFTVHNLLQWLINHGPRILGIIITIVTSLWLSRMVEARLVSLIASRGGIGNREERENRARTLLGIFHNAANIIVLGGGAVALLDEVGIPVTPLIGGAAVVGLAVAFGAQSLIKDYFTGFLVLLEQQYLVNDSVKIGEITGQVERITLRTTMLRDLEGRVHFIPHGQIGAVTNTTHGWARAVFDIRVGYRENVDHVIDILMQLSRELCASEAFRGMILGDPVMLGVEALTDSGVTIKFHIKTRAAQSGPVKRELLRRIKNKFDELGIEIPTQQLTIRRRQDGPFPVVADDRNRLAG